MPISGSSLVDLSILEGRLSAARAAALDELLAANIPADLAGLVADLVVILADVTGLAGAAMRGTDSAFLAANFIPDVDVVRGTVPIGGNLTLDKSGWTKVFFAIYGNTGEITTGEGFECDALDLNTLTMKNSGSMAVDLGIGALRVI